MGPLKTLWLKCPIEVTHFWNWALLFVSLWCLDRALLPHYSITLLINFIYVYVYILGGFWDGNILYFFSRRSLLLIIFVQFLNLTWHPKILLIWPFLFKESPHQLMSLCCVLLPLIAVFWFHTQLLRKMKLGRWHLNDFFWVR